MSKKRPHQKLAITLAKKYYVKHKRGKIIWPCGTGKSLLGYWLAEAYAVASSMKARRIVICVPSLALVKQTLGVWQAESKGRMEFLCVCSDKTVSRSKDEWEVSADELGIDVTTSPAKIQAFLKSRSGKVKVVFTTYQSGAALCHGAKGIKFDFGIYDESHKTAGQEGLWTTLLYDENLKVSRRLFLTATERRYSGDREDVVSMDDESIYGSTIHTISFKEAIEGDLLSDYRITTVKVLESELKAFFRDNSQVRIKSGDKVHESEIRQIVAAIAARKLMDKHKLRRGIAFSSSVARAREFERLNEFLTESKAFRPVTSHSIHGAMDSSERDGIMKAFESDKRSIISNCRCLVEGVDIPSVDLIVFVDPRTSVVDCVQAAGRALRKCEGKKMGYIVIPVLVHDDEKVDKIECGDSRFKGMISIVRALAASDERIIEQMARAYNKRRSAGDGGIGDDLPSDENESGSLDDDGYSVGGVPEDGTDVIDFSALGSAGQQFDLSAFKAKVEPHLYKKVERLIPIVPVEYAIKRVRELGLKNHAQYTKARLENIL